MLFFLHAVEHQFFKLGLVSIPCSDLNHVSCRFKLAGFIELLEKIYIMDLTDQPMGLETVYMIGACAWHPLVMTRTQSNYEIVISSNEGRKPYVIVFNRRQRRYKNKIFTHVCVGALRLNIPSASFSAFVIP